MQCSFCGYEGTDVPAGDRRHAEMRGESDGERTVIRCERCGTALSTGESAALFFEKLKLLAQFGLAAHTRLLLGTSRQDR